VSLKERTLFVSILQLWVQRGASSSTTFVYLMFSLLLSSCFPIGGAGVGVGVMEMETKATKFCKVFSQHLRIASCGKIMPCNETHVWTRENMQTTICPREKKKQTNKQTKQASLESSIKKKQKVSQIMELLHTCKRFMHHAP
jgi:NADH:ubiquinone oxidoreductase subunit F (NADH-binding)